MIKKILILLTLAIATLETADACCYHNNYFHGGPRGCCVGGWIAPIAVGGLIGYEIARPTEVIVQQPVIIQQQPAPPVGYHYVTIVDPLCNCYKQALVPN